MMDLVEKYLGESLTVPVWQDTNKKIKIVYDRANDVYYIAKGTKAPMKKKFKSQKDAVKFAYDKKWIKFPVGTQVNLSTGGQEPSSYDF